MGWQIVSSGKRLGLWSIAAVDENAALAVGDAGTILRTTDGGDRWEALRAGEGGSFLAPLDRINKAMNVVHQRTGGGCFVLFGVAVTGPDVCWAAGTEGLIVKTEDTGVTWQVQVSGTSGTLRTSQALDAETAWAAGSGGLILRTSNGKNWVEQQTGVAESIRSLPAVDATTAWAVGTGGLILKPEDSGASWKRQESPVLLDLVSVAGVSREAAWACGARGTVIRTVDGGDA
jgi:photosystem II stability/assembly factor-like uncharacterized protein